MKSYSALVVSAALWMTVAAPGCKRPQELPVVVSAGPDSNRLQWRDVNGPLRGEVPWVLRTDLLGPDTYLVVETADGARCAREVSFRVLAAGVTEYTVTLVSDLRGRVSWRVDYGAGQSIRLFTCSPRPADDPRQGCIRGRIPKPLFGELVGEMSVELAGGSLVQGVRVLRFERGFACDAGAVDPVDEASSGGSELAAGDHTPGELP
jgi:hypothetical protein